jgi:hypothetical protein
MLTSKTQSQPVDSIRDLISQKNLKILVMKNSFVEDILRGSNYYPSLQDQIEFYDEKIGPQETKRLLSKVVARCTFNTNKPSVNELEISFKGKK